MVYSFQQFFFLLMNRKLAWELSEQPNTSTRPLSGRNNPTQAPSGQIFLVQGEQVLKVESICNEL
jgi:hypothetical protein